MRSIILSLCIFMMIFGFPAAIMYGEFQHNLPEWCANLDRPGNFLIAGLCEKK